jgi:hypothetical protein
MTMVEFFQTMMGHRFFEATMPKLVEAVEASAKATKRLAEAMEENNRLLLAAQKASADKEAKS